MANKKSRRGKVKKTEVTSNVDADNANLRLVSEANWQVPKVGGEGSPDKPVRDLQTRLLQRRRGHELAASIGQEIRALGKGRESRLAFAIQLKEYWKSWRIDPNPGKNGDGAWVSDYKWDRKKKILMFYTRKAAEEWSILHQLAHPPRRGRLRILQLPKKQGMIYGE